LGRDADAAEARRPRAARLCAGRDAALLGGADRALQLRFDRGELFGGPRPDLRLARRVVRECVYDNLRSAVARRDGDQITWNPRFLTLRGHYAFHAHACTPQTPREKGSVEGGVRHLKTGFWPVRRFSCLAELDEQYVRWRDTVCNRRIHATGRFPVFERLAHEREVLRPLPPTAFDFAGGRPVRVPLDGYLKLGGNFYRAPLALVHQRVELRFDRDQVWVRHAGETVASYPRSYEQGCWFPPPAMRPEPPAAASVAGLVVPQVAPPELADYAELSA
jgi:hypothetical protein